MARGKVNITEGDVDGFQQIFTRIPVNADPDKSWNHMENTILEAERDTITLKVGDAKVENGILHTPDRDVDLTQRGMTALLKQFKIDGAQSAYNTLSEPAHVAQAKEHLEGLLGMVMRERQNAHVKIHTANIDGKEQVVHVSNANVNQPSVIDQFYLIQESCKALNMRPIEFYSTLDLIQMKLVEVDNTWDLTAREDSLHGHQFFGGQTKDTFYGMITVGLSETKASNKLYLGSYAKICENGAIITSSDDAVSLEAVGKAKGSFSMFLETAFRAIAGKSGKLKDAIDRMSLKTFTADDLFALQKQMEAANIINQWNKYIKDDATALLGSTRRKAFDLVTLRGHDERIPVQARQRLEKIGGEMLLLNAQ